MNEAFDVGVALAIGFIVGMYFGVWVRDVFIATSRISLRTLPSDWGRERETTNPSIDSPHG